MSFDDDLNACAALVEKGDPARFRTVMMAPVAARRVLFPIYAMNVEISRAPWVTGEAIIAEMRLQWWRDALEEIASGGPVRRHEVVTPLADVLSAELARDLDTSVEARRWDCYKDPFEDEAHLDRYLRATSGTLMSVTARALGGTAGAAEQAGFALGVANWFLAIPKLESQKRIPLVDGSADGVRSLAEDALAAFGHARTDKVPAEARPAFWPATGCDRVLRAAFKTPGRVADGTLPEPGRLSLPLRAAMGRW